MLWCSLATRCIWIGFSRWFLSRSRPTRASESGKERRRQVEKSLNDVAVKERSCPKYLWSRSRLGRVNPENWCTGKTVIPPDNRLASSLLSAFLPSSSRTLILHESLHLRCFMGHISGRKHRIISSIETHGKNRPVEDRFVKSEGWNDLWALKTWNESGLKISLHSRRLPFENLWHRVVPSYPIILPLRGIVLKVRLFFL